MVFERLGLCRFVAGGLLLLPASCAHSPHEAESETALSAARNAVATLYRCFELVEPALCDRVLDDEGRQIFDAAAVQARHDTLVGHEIVEARVVEPDPRFGIQEGDVQILVEETYRDRSWPPRVMSYVLRSEGSEWRIWSWAIDDPAEVPPEDLSIPSDEPSDE